MIKFLMGLTPDTKYLMHTIYHTSFSRLINHPRWAMTLDNSATRYGVYMPQQIGDARPSARALNHLYQPIIDSHLDQEEQNKTIHEV